MVDSEINAFNSWALFFCNWHLAFADADVKLKSICSIYARSMTYDMIHMFTSCMLTNVSISLCGRFHSPQ